MNKFSSLLHIDSKTSFNAIPMIAFDAFDYLRFQKESASRYILIRHGESTSNAEKSIAGRKMDVTLTPKGIRQAKEAADRLALTAIGIHAVYCSPSKRALETASLFYNKCRPIVDERLYEKFYGPYEGASEEEYRPVRELEEQENTGPHKHFFEKFQFKAHPHMESMSDIHKRVSHFLLEKHEQHEGQNVIVATHNGILKAFFMETAATLGLDVDYRSFIVGNASLLILEVDHQGIKAKATTGFSFLY